MEIIELFTQFTPLQIIVFLVLLCLGIKGFLDFVVYIKNIILEWHNKENAEDEKENEIENRIRTLEEHDDWKYNKILNLEAGQININKKLDDLKETNRLEVIAQYRSTIYRLHKEFTTKGYLTQSEYEMFHDLADIYLNYGGNGYYRHRIIPEIEELPIHE
jgi:hypothetical protein